MNKRDKKNTNSKIKETNKTQKSIQEQTADLLSNGFKETLKALERAIKEKQLRNERKKNTD